MNKRKWWIIWIPKEKWVQWAWIIWECKIWMAWVIWTWWEWEIWCKIWMVWEEQVQEQEEIIIIKCLWLKIICLKWFNNNVLNNKCYNNHLWITCLKLEDLCNFHKISKKKINHLEEYNKKEITIINIKIKNFKTIIIKTLPKINYLLHKNYLKNPKKN